VRTRHPTEELTALVDGALPAPRAAEVLRHVESCASCRAERARIAGAIAALRRLPAAPEPSPLFATRLAARLAREGRPAPSLSNGARRPWLVRLGAWLRPSALRWKIAVPASAAAVAAGVAVFAVHLQREEERAVAAHLELLLDYEVVSGLGDVESAEDAAVVAALDDLAPERKEGRP
jgi:anti-sigma factor RsiW